MNNLTRWDPFREIMDMRRVMDRFLENNYLGAEAGAQSLGMPLDVCETQDGYDIEASLPGIKPEDVDITLDRNTLTIRGETKSEDERGERNYHLRERRSGTFMRSITLPSNIDADQIQASYEDGVLKLYLPKAEESRPKRIQVHNAGGAKQIGDKSQGKR